MAAFCEPVLHRRAWSLLVRLRAACCTPWATCRRSPRSPRSRSPWPGAVSLRRRRGAARRARARAVPAARAPHAVRHRLPARLLRPARARPVARHRRGAHPGAAGAHPPALPLQQHQRGALAHPLRAAARRARARGPGRPLPRADGRQPHARADRRRGASWRASTSRSRALRLGERLRVTWRIDTMPADALVPPLVLQPLVENAVYHGIEPSPDGGEIGIDIGARRRPAGDDPHQPAARPRAAHAVGQQDGARQHPRAPAAALRRRGEHALRGARRAATG